MKCKIVQWKYCTINKVMLQPFNVNCSWVLCFYPACIVPASGPLDLCLCTFVCACASVCLSVPELLPPGDPSFLLIGRCLHSSAKGVCLLRVCGSVAPQSGGTPSFWVIVWSEYLFLAPEVFCVIKASFFLLCDSFLCHCPWPWICYRFPAIIPWIQLLRYKIH